MNRKSSLLLCLILLIGQILCYGQKKGTLYNNVIEEKWLPRQTIRTVFQDSKGNMWVGTNSGLYKYNLYNVINYNLSQQINNRLLNNTIHCIGEDNNGNILVGTESGLGLLNPITGSLSVLTSNDATIVNICSNSDGSTWIVNSIGEIFRLDNSDDFSKPQYLVPFVRIETFDGSVDIKINTIATLANGDLLLGTNIGLYHISRENEKIFKTTFKKNITAIYVTSDQKIFAGTAENGLYILESDTNSQNIIIKKNITGAIDFITSISGTKESSYLTVTTPRQAFFLDAASSNATLQEINNTTTVFNEGTIGTSFMDRTSNIWIGSKRGLYMIRRQSLNVDFFDVHLSGSAINNNLTDIFYDEGDFIYVMAGINGYYRINKINGKQDKINLPFKSVNKMRKAANGDIIILADRKIISISKQNFYQNPQPHFNVLFDSHNTAEINDFNEIFPGEWWLTSWNMGLIRVMQNERSIPSNIYLNTCAQFSNRTHLYSLTKDNDDNIWIATRGEGVVKINTKQNKITHYSKDNKFHIPSNRIICINEDSKGRIWIGTRGDGLLLYNKDCDNFTVFDTKNGLPSNTVCALEETSSGELWISTLNGLAKFQERQLIPFLSYGIQDGINNPEHIFNVSAKDKQGAVYFGNGNGLYKVRQEYSNNARVYPVVWTQIELLSRKKDREFISDSSFKAMIDLKLVKNENIILEHNQNNIKIGFASLDFTAPEKNRYAYRLVGKDSAWQYLEGTQQSVEYYDLPSGDYQFEVKNANSHGLWTNKARLLGFTIQPSFWQSRSGYILYAVLLIISSLIIYILWRRWFRLNKKLKHEIKAGELYNQQMVFYTDLSHEIKNRLSLILGPLEQALQGKKVNQSILNSLYDQGLRLKRLTDQIMNIRKSEKGQFILNVGEENIKAFIEKICRDSEPLAIVKNISFLLTCRKEDISGWCDEELLEIILMNLIGNGIKYCKVGGSVEVKIDTQYIGHADFKNSHCREGNYLLCTITDKGIGIPAEDIALIKEPFYRAANTRLNRKEMNGVGIGLDLVTRLINLHHGWLDIQSELNSITTVSFYLPLEKSQYSINELKPGIDHTPIVLPSNHMLQMDGEDLILPIGKKRERVDNSQKWNILVVDDSSDMRNLVADVLSTEFVIHTASNGAEGLEFLEREEIHLIVSDLSMPVMDGLTFCHEVRNQKKTTHLPFIILTGRSSEEQKLVCFQNEVDDFIEKPFSPELLRWRVKSLLRKSAQAMPARIKTVMVVEPKAEIPESAEDQFIQSIINLIEQNLDKDYLDVDFLAENMYTSRATFYRRMEQLVGESPSGFIRKYRLKKAALFLKAGYSVAEVATKTGFSSPKYFSKCFQKEFGNSPTHFIGQQHEPE